MLSNKEVKTVKAQSKTNLTAEYIGSVDDFKKAITGPSDSFWESFDVFAVFKKGFSAQMAWSD